MPKTVLLLMVIQLCCPLATMALDGDRDSLLAFEYGHGNSEFGSRSKDEFAPELTFRQPGREIADPLDSCDNRQTYDIKQQVKKAVSIYEDALMDVFGNGVCQFFMSLFNKPKYQHIEKRLSQLKCLLRALKISKTQEEISDDVSIVTIELGMVKSLPGQTFLATCQDVMSTIANRNLVGDDLNTSANCVVCMENLRFMIAMPCRHLALCASCYLKYRTTGFTNCPMCRTEIGELTTIKKCATCLHKRADYIAESCGHSAYCTTCFDERQHNDCPECKLNLKDGFKPIYH